MLLSDIEIEKHVINHDMINPFNTGLIRKVEEQKVISYGLSSFGYDIRLSSKEFKIFRHIPGEIVDPKDFNPDFLEDAQLKRSEKGEFFIIPANSYGLGCAIERLTIPNDVSVVCHGKSTYARCGISANITPAEAGWKGILTLEFSNSSKSDVKIYANEGVAQLLFFKSDHRCKTSYSDRNGKYQDQRAEITLPLV